jgi:ATP-dependent HslUV protease ATP-binding subunit HslU
MTPREIVSELDRYIVGQREAKRAVAIALRNRWRRQQVAPELRDEIAPKNIIMIGPPGSARPRSPAGSPSWRRRPSSRWRRPSSPRSATSGATSSRSSATSSTWRSHGDRGGEGRGGRPAPRSAPRSGCSTSLLPRRPRRPARPGWRRPPPSPAPARSPRPARSCAACCARACSTSARSRSSCTESGASPMVEIFTPQGVEEMERPVQGPVLGNLIPKPHEAPQKIPAEARACSSQEEAAKLVDMEAVRERRSSGSSSRASSSSTRSTRSPPRPAAGSRAPTCRARACSATCCRSSRARRHTKHGPVRTDHILFIASGAFHVAKPSDLIPEFQGRFPIRVELGALPRRLRPHPDRARQRAGAPVRALLATEGVARVPDDGVAEIAEIAASVNERTENIGARRLHTVLERLLDEVSFDAPEMPSTKAVTIDAAKSASAWRPWFAMKTCPDTFCRAQTAVDPHS